MDVDPGPSRQALAAQVRALHALVERQRLYIGSMRASRFWKLRDALFALLARAGIGYEPLPVPTASDLATTAAAEGDAYQLLRMRQQRTENELDSLRSLVRLLATRDPIDVIVDARGASAGDLERTMTSLSAQVYPHWNAHVLSAAAADVSPALDAAITIVAVDAGDVLEPDALLLVAIEFYDGADVVYTDEDRYDAAGVPGNPRFKPDWSPESALTRDYTGRLCAFRAAALRASGGVNTALGPAMWYDALLRVSEHTEAIVHVPRVAVHRRHGNDTSARDEAAAAVRDALMRRGERAELRPAAGGIDVRFAVPGNERVSVIVPTRDAHALLGRCLASIFEKTAYRAFEVIVVDNGSTEPETAALLDAWAQREPERFRVIADAAPFNFSRLNNNAVAASTADFVVLLNNDTEVIAPEWMSAMLGQARRAPIGAVGALLYYEDGSIQHAGVMLGGVLGLAGHAYRFVREDAVAERPELALDTNYIAVTGACLMVARQKYVEAGGMDESLAVAYNDIDLCMKLRALGYRNVVVPSAKLFHYESKSRGDDDTPAKAARAFAESEAFRHRWPDESKNDPYYNPNLTVNAEDFSVRR